MFESLRRPRPVRPGDHIRIVSPGLPTLTYIPDRAHRAEQTLTDMGFTASYGSRARLVSADGLTAGSARERALDLMEAFTDPSVHAILAADTGLASREVLDHLDPALIAANPKPFIGYCDTAYVNLYLASQAGLSSLYGCTYMIHLGEAGGAYPETSSYLIDALDSDRTLVCTPVKARTGGLISWFEPELERRPRPLDLAGGWTWLRPGTAQGAFLGGEISQLPELADYFGLSLRSSILFWDISFHRRPVQPLFKELCDRTDLTGLAAMVVGTHPLIPPAEWAAIVGDLLTEFLPGGDFPVEVNSDLSHTCPSWTTPYGERAILTADRLTFPRRTA
jgi:muramoyltetrapeptide carboxypeptidase